MSLLHERTMGDLTRAGYVPQTRSVYINSIRRIAEFHNRSPELLGPDDIRAWLDSLTSRGDIGLQRMRQHMSGLSSSNM